MSLNSETVNAVIEHMNEDHQDACLCMVRAFSDRHDATAATLLELDCEGMTFSVPGNNDSQASRSEPDRIRIQFSKTIRSESQIRGMLVGMSRQARQMLDMN